MKNVGQLSRKKEGKVLVNENNEEEFAVCLVKKSTYDKLVVSCKRLNFGSLI
jgi:hypothetical protein